MQTMTNAPTATDVDHTLVYRFEGELAEMYPTGVFPEGIRFHNGFEARVVAGPFEGGRIFGVDQFLLRPDGVGVIVAPEVIEKDDVRVEGEVRGYVLPPDGMQMPPLDVLAEPGFEFPDVDFRVTAAVTFRTADPRYDHLNRAVGRIQGTVNLATRRLVIEARAE